MINYLKNIYHKLYEINQNFESKHKPLCSWQEHQEHMKNIHENP